MHSVHGEVEFGVFRHHLGQEEVAGCRSFCGGSNHVTFDREMRYADFGRLLIDQPVQNLSSEQAWMCRFRTLARGAGVDRGRRQSP